MKNKHQKSLEALEIRWRWRIKKCGLSLFEFCEKYGVSYNTFIRIAKSNPTIRALDEIENAVTRLESDFKNAC